MDSVSFHEHKCPEDLKAVLAQVEEKERRLVEKINRVMRMKTKLTTRKNDLNDKLKSTRSIRRNVTKELKRSTLLALAAGGEKVVAVTATASAVPPKAKTPKPALSQKTKKPKPTPAQKVEKLKATSAPEKKTNTKKPKDAASSPEKKAKTKKPKDAASSPEKKAKVNNPTTASSPEKKAKTKNPTTAAAPEEKKTKKLKGAPAKKTKQPAAAAAPEKNQP